MLVQSGNVIVDYDTSGMGENSVGLCKCGYTKDVEKNCDGSHKTVKAVKEEITRKIESVPAETIAAEVKLVTINIVKNA